jgi:hypothetical protein
MLCVKVRQGFEKVNEFKRWIGHSLPLVSFEGKGLFGREGFRAFTTRATLVDLHILGTPATANQTLLELDAFVEAGEIGVRLLPAGIEMRDVVAHPFTTANGFNSTIDSTPPKFSNRKTAPLQICD